ncbi:DEAD/DEAH box helicase [Methylobacterium sp. J-068]|uniref:DEAD/DEAH box helicase n=1 Tax=Methylobacterium sp. J-068 TaxID=2836649 RepID=UPI001FB8EFC0|nr:DEAD/DEAH box helicase [Methylobacterium sp. J-068]MCJ2037072.1 DEAD/DEAH box helicase [Methylobacterium sp. J-068]
MAGRVGRMGQAAAEGNVIITADSATTSARALKFMDFESQEELGAGINPDDFNLLTLQLFAGKLCSSRREAFELLASTLSAARELERNRSGVAHWESHLNSQIDRLLRSGCLIEGRGRIGVTAFGLSVARSGLKAETALYFINSLVENGSNLISLLPGTEDALEEDDILFILAHAALSSPEFSYEGGNPTRQISYRVGRPNLVTNEYARKLDALLFNRPWAADVSAANGALLIVDWAAGLTRGRIERRVAGVRLGTVESLARDVGWILTGISETLSDVTAPTLADESKPDALRGDGPAVAASRQLARSIRRMATRIASGLPSEVLWMTNLELLGARKRLNRQQILSLRFQGLVKPMALMDGGGEADDKRRLALSATAGAGAALPNQVRDAARRWKATERDHSKQHHLKRAGKVEIGELISNLYLHRGNALEAVFEAVMSSISVTCEKLDHANKQAHPDFLITIEDFPPIVVEIKSKASDSDLVSLNAAAEVLVASELIGLKGNFCLTLCSPGVEPNVPGLVERCGRLCVIEATRACRRLDGLAGLAFSFL